MPAASETQPLIQFYVDTSDILAFVHFKNSVKCHAYSNGVSILEKLLGRWKYLIDSSPSKVASERTRLTDERDIMRRLGDWLLPPLEIPQETDNILIIPEAQLTRVPWSAISSGGQSLLDKHQILLAPSVQHYHFASKQSTRSTRKQLYVGRLHNLPFARREIEIVRDRFGNRHTEVYDPCYREHWPDTGQAQIWHFTGHAHLRTDNPFYSSLLLANGPLFAADFRLKRHRVNLVTLAACRTGQQTQLPGEESSGLVRSILEMGARTIVAGNWAVSDQSTTTWIDKFYTYYLNGAAALAAARTASLETRERFPSAFDWGAFSVFGAAKQKKSS